jgi:hypothetical protein
LRVCEAEAAQGPIVAEVDFGGIQLIVLKSEFDVVDDLDFVVVQVENLLVENVILEQDQILLRRALELRHHPRRYRARSPDWR